METEAIPKPPPAQLEWQRRRAASPVWPSAESIIFAEWTENPSQALKAAKEKISPLEINKRWELIKKMVNPYEMVFTHQDPFFHPSISVIKPLSRSYFKLIEMLDVMHFFEGLSKTNPKMRTAHVAEGPGGFIQAVLHLAERHKKIVTQATAMTLKPTDSYVPGWRRATNFLHHNRQVKLHYGQDGTGDIYIPANQTSFIEAVRPGVHIFTADGGFDFSVDYSVQEFKVFRLLVCSALVGIQSLLQDGVFILKVFDSFSESTQILLVVLSRCFKEWALYKPLLSRPCNSERYFIGRGFKGVTTSMLQTLKRMQYECETNGVYPRGVRDLATEDEMAYLEQNTRESIGAQLYYLARAEQFALKPEIWYEKQMAADFQMSLAWCSRYRIPTRYVSPVTLTAPPLISSECISGQGVGQQSQLPGDGSGCLVPCDQA